jgi:uncharacterized protein
MEESTFGKDNSRIDNHEIAFTLFEEGHCEEAFERYLTLAEGGSTTAQLFVGWMYHAGQGVKRDLAEARRWYQKAADGNSMGQFYLGTLFRSEHQYQAAVEWLEKSASQGYPPALYRLGRMYDTGEGVPADYERAYSYFERAAKMGHLLAQREVAVKMLKGHNGSLYVFKGLYLFIRVFFQGVLVAWKDLDSDMVRH